MGSLVIRQVEYVGDQYRYKSPSFGFGINIIEGKNGSGKTTFVDLICFALGVYVREFDTKGKETHKEVCNDTNNYVVLDIKINGADFTIKRYFKSNVIFVTEGKEVHEFPVYRQESESLTFSDWIMHKLKIKVVEIYQGNKKNKINFPDVFRLMHYDQDTLPHKIYKVHRNENNFVADSLFVRKVIFEILMGTAFTDYYSKIGELIKLEREKETKKSVLDSYRDIIAQTNIVNNKTVLVDIVERNGKIKLQLTKAELYLSSLKNSEYTTNDIRFQIDSIRRDLIDSEIEYGDLSIKKVELLNEHRGISNLREEIILEVTQLRKIIAAHDELKLFSPDTCPYCLKHVEREEHHCICGSRIDESQYERFFYTSEEYLDILHSKQKSVDTIDTALKSCEQDIASIGKKIAEIEIKRAKKREELEGLGSIVSARNAEFNEANDTILDLKEKLQLMDQQIEMLKKLDELESGFQNAKSNLERGNTELARQEAKVMHIMNDKLERFNSIYSKLLVDSSKNIHNAKIDEDYMPIINEGEYKEASSSVPKRFMYYLALLNMSLEEADMLYPKFLLIDTPENLGIDHENLDDCISKILENKTEEDMEKFQVILTTGINKYPSQLKHRVFETINKENRLLKRVISEEQSE